MRIPFFSGLVLFFGIATAAAVSNKKTDIRPSSMQPHVDDNSSNNAEGLLFTLQELHRSLITEIDGLEKMLKNSPAPNENTEMTHLVQHYTAQKNNIEREISLIRSIQASPTSVTAPRHILQNHSPEEKIVPSLFNIFKKAKNPSSEESNDDIGYSLPYPSYYNSGYGPQYPNPYHGPPPKPNYPYPNGLTENTFPGYEPAPNPHQHVFKDVAQPGYQPPPAEQPNLQIYEQYTPPPHVMLQSEVQPPQPEPLQSQFQLQPDVAPPFKVQSQLEGLAQQVSEVETPATMQQGQYGQKQGVFIYYPNGVVNEDRPSIVDRFGQAIDRFGQAISNLANRQLSRSPAQGSDSAIVQKSTNNASKNRVRSSRPRSSSEQNPKTRKLKDTKPKLRWISV